MSKELLPSYADALLQFYILTVPDAPCPAQMHSVTPGPDDGYMHVLDHHYLILAHLLVR